MSAEPVRRAYAARAAEYAAAFGDIDAAAQQDRGLVLAWALSVPGLIIDVGCGPGQWTSYLSSHGVHIEGIDPVAEFVDAARQHHPHVPFRLGQAEALDVDDAELGGVLAWFSLIHTDPDAMAAPLNEFARCIRPGGSVAIGFFEGPSLVPFDHAVTTAYFWPAAELAARVERAGFAVTDARARTDPGVRRQGLIIAERTV